MDQTPYRKLAEHYDMGWGDFAESSRAFVLKTLARCGVESGRIVEMACGTGILAAALARAGYTVLGIDRSSAMIDIAQTRAEFVSGLMFRIGDMRCVQVGTGFDAALCMFDSLNYLTSLEGVADAFAVVSRALRPEGVFVFDFNRPLPYSAHDGESLKRTISEGILVQELHYEATQRIARTVFRFPDGEIETHVQRAYELEEILPCLSTAGLQMTDCYSDFSRRPVSSLSERLICVSRKR
jgi:SAM-dependent methyltransferase